MIGKWDNTERNRVLFLYLKGEKVNREISYSMCIHRPSCKHSLSPFHLLFASSKECMVYTIV